MMLLGVVTGALTAGAGMMLWLAIRWRDGALGLMALVVMLAWGIVLALSVAASGQERLTPLGDGGLVTKWRADGTIEQCWTQDLGGLGVQVVCPSARVAADAADDADDAEGDDE